MKNKYWVLIIAALTVIGTFWTQTELGGKKYRTHQHKEYLSVEDTIPDVQEAINSEQISESHKSVLLSVRWYFQLADQFSVKNIH